jgi:ribose transport system substrate-binding protein
MKRKLLLALIISLMVVSLGFSQSKVYRIGVTMPSATHGWMANANWWATKAKNDWEGRDKSVRIELKFSGTVSQQVADIEDLLVKKVDALVVFPHDTS